MFLYPDGFASMGEILQAWFNRTIKELLLWHGELGIWLQQPRLWVKGSGISATAAQVTAATWIQSLAQELPYATDASIKKKKKKNRSSHRGAREMNLGIKLFIVVPQWQLPTHGLFRSVLFYFQMFEDSLLVFLLISTLILLWLGNILYMISIFSSVLMFVLWSRI